MAKPEIVYIKCYTCHTYPKFLTVFHHVLAQHLERVFDSTASWDLLVKSEQLLGQENRFSLPFLVENYLK